MVLNTTCIPYYPPPLNFMKINVLHSPNWHPQKHHHIISIRTISTKNNNNNNNNDNNSNINDINEIKLVQTSKSSSFLSVLCPLLKLFSGGDPSQERNYIFEEATSSLSSLARLLWGSKSLPISTISPPQNLQLYEFEACPFCRRVREAITELNLSVEIYPCPKGSNRHREIVRRLGGKEQFPYLVDPNTGVSMYESGAIVKYLFQKYGKGQSPSFGLLESTPLTGWMPTILRAGRGMTLWERAKTDPPAKKLELFSFENNPYARIVREALCELELPYIHQTVGEGSGRINSLLELSGSREVPYIIDPNTGTQVGDYKKILAYLFQTYSKDAA